MLPWRGGRERSTAWRGRRAQSQVSSLADAQLLDLQNWVNDTYHKKYFYEGVAAGAEHPSAFSERRVDGVEVE